MFNTYAFGKQGHSTLSHKTDNKLGIYDPWGLFQVSNYGINRQTVLVNNSNSGRILQCFYIRPTLWPMHLYARSLNCWNLDSGLSFRLNFSSLVSFRRTSENDFTDFLRAGRHWRHSTRSTKSKVDKVELFDVVARFYTNWGHLSRSTLS